MNYQFLKFQFATGVHFGEGGLVTCGITLSADIIFSALCCEAIRDCQETLDFLVKEVSEGRFILSDAMPFIGDRYYIPKPMLRVEIEQDASFRKNLKKLNYLPADRLNDYLRGEMNVCEEIRVFHDYYGREYMTEKASVSYQAEASPYAVRGFRFCKNSGLYICIGYENAESLEKILALFESMQYTGLGGKKNAGLGRFELCLGKSDPEMIRRFQRDNFHKFISLSVTLPVDSEIENAMEGAAYLLKKRSGFIASDEQPGASRKKKTIYMMCAGSVFQNQFLGGLFDVSPGGTHPVYRYGKAFLMGVDG